MNILLIEPYFSGSHKSWALGYKKHSAHEVNILSLPGRNWKWRMRGGAITLAREFLENKLKPDLILATDMLDLSNFLSLTRKETGKTKTAVYFHENQFSYPESSKNKDVTTKNNKYYGFINLSTALSADKALFNSKFHLNNFLAETEKFLKTSPDFNELDLVGEIKNKSEVLHLGLDLSSFDHHYTETINPKPTILWNHRWEYDKNPEEFFNALIELSERKIEFNLIVLGEQLKSPPAAFIRAKELLVDKIIHWGFAEEFSDYAKLLWQADILPVTSNQEFFGASVAEAIYCNTIPILPNRLSYPELVPDKLKNKLFYNNKNELVDMLIKTINDLSSAEQITTELQEHISQFDWSKMVKKYDKSLLNQVG